MRPVNLIPPDQRRGDRAAMRTGAFSYVLIGGLVVALLGVALLALTGKQISDKKSEVAQLQQEETATQAKAQSLAAFTQFRAAQESRSGTITSLAQSRFDWQRVLNEFARVIPSDVWLTKLAGTADPAVTVSNGPEIQTRDSIPGPALELEGCASSQEAVAGLIANLQEIDPSVRTTRRPGPPRHRPPATRVLPGTRIAALATSSLSSRSSPPSTQSQRRRRQPRLRPYRPE